MTSTQFQQISDFVWIYPTHPDKHKVQPAVGAVITPTQTVLYDAGNSPTHARKIAHALDTIHAHPVRLVIYSHFHWDHIFGAQVFDAPVIAHRICADRVQRHYIERPWSREYLQQQIIERPHMSAIYTSLIQLIPWDTFEVIAPSIVFDEPIIHLELDGVTLQLEHIGGRHADDSTILRVLEDRVMLLSDTFYPPFGQAGADLDMVQRFLDEQYTFYVDGHNEIFTHQSLTAWRNSPLRTR
ncbi:MAG: MBL fold metallo-hydrolase [Anaerolineae bacterium]|jgi:glyoxylase-like metal-dependent hydrolase (beta-lactamase superfamily II)|nr:MBL fold metallo-hydrolase [Anaerolineae bacterium]